MSDTSDSSKKPRRYPTFWEKAVPIVLGLLGIAFLVLLVIILAVATGVH